MMMKAEVYGHNGHITVQTPEFQVLKDLNEHPFPNETPKNNTETTYTLGPAESL